MRMLKMLRPRTANPKWMLRLAGAFTWFMIGTPHWVDAVLRMGHGPRFFSGVAAHVVFFIVFVWTTLPRPERQTLDRMLLAGYFVQTVASLVMTWCVGGSLSPALLTIVAGQLPTLLSPGLASGWVFVQTILLGLLLLLGMPMPIEGPFTYVLSHLAFQAFALGAASLVRSEARARAELARANAELLGTQALLTETSRTVERLRISRELHDVLGHHLTALLLQLEAAARVPPERSGEHLRLAVSQTRSLITETRAAVSTLRAEGHVDVRPAIRILVQGIQHPNVHLTLDEELDLREPSATHALFRCVQEILTNTLRHSGAENLWLSCVRAEGRVELRARDDGRGSAATHPGNGLLGMRERLEELGGGLEIQTAQNQGFAIHAWVPLRGSS